MRSRRYVVQDPHTGKYVLSLRLYFLGQRIPEKTSFLSEARHVLPALRDELGQTVTIGLVEDTGVRVVEILRHRSAIQITTPPGTLFALHDSAQGKVALAFGPASLWQYLERGIRPVAHDAEAPAEGDRRRPRPRLGRRARGRADGDQRARGTGV
ncbi:MAG: hypothetical protein U5K76_01600 [Woeseiaceae bacterium]|nr:hypothetical protein [Woeseiaceae bacterium]